MFSLFKKTIKVGSKAPDFILPSHLGGKIRLSDFRGKKNVILAFYPMDWTPVCTNQIPGYEQNLAHFEKLDTQVLVISVDSVPCHQAWQKTLGGISYPMLADNSPHGEVARKYGVLTASGYSDRVIFIVDKQGIIRFIDRPGLQVLPDNKQVLEELSRINQ
nr:redoxin domain-containing protein [candidate division Zixibacteria bacterium]